MVDLYLILDAIASTFRVADHITLFYDAEAAKP